MKDLLRASYRWHVVLGRFRSVGSEVPIEEGTSLHFELSTVPDRCKVRVTSPQGGERVLEGRIVADQVVCEVGETVLLVRAVARPGGQPFLCGLWLATGDRGDTPIGTWTAEEQTLDDAS